MYKKAKDANEPQELIEELRNSFIKHANLARWEDQVLNKTRYGSPEQKLLLQTSFRVIQSETTTRYPLFRVPMKITSTIEFILTLLVQMMYLISCVLFVSVLIFSGVFLVIGQWKYLLSYLIILVGPLCFCFSLRSCFSSWNQPD